MEDHLTTAEVSALLRLTPRRVRQLAGQIGGVLRGRDYLFPRATVEAFGRRPRPKPGRRPKPAAAP